MQKLKLNVPGKGVLHGRSLRVKPDEEFLVGLWHRERSVAPTSISYRWQLMQSSGLQLINHYSKEASLSRKVKGRRYWFHLKAASAGPDAVFQLRSKDGRLSGIFQARLSIKESADDLTVTLWSPVENIFNNPLELWRPGQTITSYFAGAAERPLNRPEKPFIGEKARKEIIKHITETQPISVTSLSGDIEAHRHRYLIPPEIEIISYHRRSSLRAVICRDPEDDLPPLPEKLRQ
jgi:hypothetical protein